MHGTVILLGVAAPSSISGVIEDLADTCRALSDDDVTLDIVVIGSERDATSELARRAAAEHGLALTVLESESTRAWNTHQLAFEHALKHSNPEFIVTLDAAGHHDPRQIPALVAAFRSNGSGVTIGSRWMRGGSAPGIRWFRGLISRFASRAVGWVTGLRRVHDITTSFRVIRSDAADLVATNPASRGDYGFYCEFVAVAQAYGFVVDEVPITFGPRFTPVEPLAIRDLVAFAGDVRRIRGRIRRVRGEMQIDQATWAVRSGRMRSQAPEIGSEFGALEELGELSGAQRFTNWIVSALRPSFGPSVLEVGAGFGAVTRTIAINEPDRTVVAIEPAVNVYSTLVDRCADLSNVTTLQRTSRQLAEGEPSGQFGPASFDTVLYVNVLEHIEHDADELETAFGLLRPGGALGVFVPAMPSLYGSLDYKSGHFRRYTRDTLLAAIEQAGFVRADVRYFDPLGVVPYWLMYRVFDVQALGSVSSTGYDRVVVPISRTLERVMPRPPRGKNLVAVAHRPS
jgi:2-polyprenyl-3-methyl-5-hydroxy-6-metoxy-1,4-benzoquinol methylase